MNSHLQILVRGGGDLASGVIHRLVKGGFRVLILETDHPMAIRRQVSFCEAVYEGSAVVEGIRAVRVNDLSEIDPVCATGAVPLLVDPKAECLGELKPHVVVDAIMAKRNLGTRIDMAPLTIALGPGFTAGKDVHLVIETMRGHDLGRVITSGCALPDTGVPGNIGGYTKERVIHSPAAGILRNISSIGDRVEKGQSIAFIETFEGEKITIPASISGILRGLIRDGFSVSCGFKIADIDPREAELKNCFTISDKSRCIAGSVLEAVCAFAFAREGAAIHD